MGDLRGRVRRPLVRLAALAWLLVISPVELASALAALLAGPGPALSVAGVFLVLLRVGVVAAGLMLGRHLLRGDDARVFAAAWAGADLGTLGIVLASEHLPSNRAPGDGPFVWLVYAAAALVVIAAASRRARTRDDVRAAP